MNDKSIVEFISRESYKKIPPIKNNCIIREYYKQLHVNICQ